MAQAHDTIVPGEGIYRDSGCSLAASCLHCPLARCRYDSPRSLTTQVRFTKHQEVAEAWLKEGLTPRELVARYGVSSRTVFRILQRARGG